MATVDCVSDAAIEENFAELQLAGYREQPNPASCPTAREAGPAVFQGEGQMIFWRACAGAYYMTPGDKEWKRMPPAGELVLQPGWQAYLTGGEILMQDLRARRG